MTRRPIPVVLVIVSAILIVAGRVNRETEWGTWVLLAGFPVLVVAGVLTLRARR